MSTLNLGRVQNWIDQGRIDPSKPVTIRELFKTKCIQGVKDGVKLLAKVHSTCLKKRCRVNANSRIGQRSS
jgi:large subunit ribosomal protein L15